MATTTVTHTTTAAAKPIALPAFPRTRRALVRLQAAHVTRLVMQELIAQPEPRHGRQPAFVRLDALTERYARLGGEPTDLLGRRRTFTVGEAVRPIGRALQTRYRDWQRRELDAGHATREHRYEIGGDFGTLP
jgi:hypothetical protein